LFVHVLYSEWLKRKRSFASAAIVGGSLFTPAVIIFVRLLKPQGVPALYAADAFWPHLWRSCWESMAVFFLPLGAILATSLITQIEFRSNAWKQVHALPVSAAAIFLAKLTVILVMLVQFLLLFNAGIYAAAMIPYALLPGVGHPKGSFLSLPLVRESALYFVDVLPIVGAQYLMALRSHNVLVPIGVGFMAWVGALAAVSSKAVAGWWPYAYTTIHYLRGGESHWRAGGFFVLLTIAGYVLFATRSEKG
jgi:hypothetical protein